MRDTDTDRDSLVRHDIVSDRKLVSCRLVSKCSQNHSHQTPKWRPAFDLPIGETVSCGTRPYLSVSVSLKSDQTIRLV